MAVEPIDLRKIDERTANIYEAIIVSARKARQINDEQKIEFNRMLVDVPAMSSDEEGEDLNNPAQMKISLEFENREKPHIQALQRLVEGEITYYYKEKNF